MAMRIHSGMVNGLAPQSVAGAEAARLGGADNRNNSAFSPGNGDSVGLSGLAARISTANEDAQVRSNQQIASLSALYSRGDEIADSVTVGRALISHALKADGDWT